jgi:hypothetical protein
VFLIAWHRPLRDRPWRLLLVSVGTTFRTDNRVVFSDLVGVGADLGTSPVDLLLPCDDLVSGAVSDRLLLLPAIFTPSDSASTPQQSKVQKCASPTWRPKSRCLLVCPATL